MPSAAPASAYGAAAARSSQPRPLSEPASQAMISALELPCARSVSASAMKADIKAEIETPARINRSGSSPLPRRASTATSTAVARPAAKPIAGIATSAAPSVTAIAIAAPAPLLTPVMYGSINGLRNSACISVPASASAAPTVAAIAMRGTRSAHTIVAVSVCDPGCASAANSAPGAMPVPPTASPKSAANGTSSATAPSRVSVSRAPPRRSVRASDIPLPLRSACCRDRMHAARAARVRPGAAARRRRSS